MKKNQTNKENNGPTVAPGMDDTEELNQEATGNEIQNGDFTEVTVVSNDEVDPS
jgi:hypothetical protein